MLACVILLRANRKARTKPICSWGVRTHLGIFSVLLWVGLSYMDRGAGVVMRLFLSGCMKGACVGWCRGCLVK